MEKNDFLLFSEVIYRLHACRKMGELQSVLLAQLKLLIPCTYASFLPIRYDPDTQGVVHGEPVSSPKEFEAMEKAWMERPDQATSLWLSHAVESVVVRDSEIMAGDKRFSTWSYQNLYNSCGIVECVQTNVTYAGRSMGRIALYRTRAEGLFTDQDAFYLRSLVSHINLAFHNCRQNQAEEQPQRPDLAELAQGFDLTQRETEILRLIFQGLNNEELLERLSISRNTLLKHLQNLYRKCGVSSRVDLLKLRP